MAKLMFTCIYCLKTEPIVSPSEAHIFPDAMGGVKSTRNTVCKNCNHKINRRFEQVEVAKFSFFQSIWGIKSRRGKIKGVPANVEYEGKRFKLSLDEEGLPKTPLVLREKDSKGKKYYSIIGPAPLVEEKQKEIENKIKPISWSEKDLTGIDLPESVIEIASDMARKSLRRLAAKVVYERWGQLRSSVVLDDAQYNNIRNFILKGEEPIVLCGILSDNRLLNGMLNFPTGYHAVVINAHPKSNVLGAFVTFYSLFYFWVILSTNFQAIAAIDDALIEDPQDQKAYVPIFRSNTGNLLVHWDHIVNPFLKNPENVAVSSMKYAINKFQTTDDEAYSSKGIKHVLAQPITGDGCE